MRPASRSWAAVGALGAILAITASWWALALWPVEGDAPAWLLRTREVCFGSTSDRLPDAGGWLLLIGQPIGMAGVLVAVWGADLRAGLARICTRFAGQVGLGVVSALLVVAAGSVVVRVRTADLDRFPVGAAEAAAALTRVNDAAPAFALTDQHGREVSLDSFRGRPILVTFAFAHCATVCPLIVQDVLTAQRDNPAHAPVVVVITLDPWRDTPARLPAIAASWGLDRRAHVLSGPEDVVERALSAWRVPRVRNERTGEISHPSLVYVLDRHGRIAYVLRGEAGLISAAIRAL